MKVLSPDEMRRMDETCIRQYKIPALILMENAASSARALIQREYPDLSILIVCGTGNNGGDGLALARQLHSLERNTKVLICGNPEKYSAEASQNLKALRKTDTPLFLNPSEKTLTQMFHERQLIVDALLGIGLNRDVDDERRRLIKLMNSSGAPILSLDIPSGLDGETGLPRGAAIQADMTICFGAPKRGNFLSPGFLYSKRIFLSRISFPPELYRDWPCNSKLNLPSPLKERDPLGYKNSFARVLIIGGGKNYQGAPALSARAAYRSGAGFVTVAIPQSQVSGFSAQCPEAVIQGLLETGEKTISEENEDLLLSLATKHDAVLIGPGMTRHESTASLIRKLIPAIRVPLVVDADGLNALAGFCDLTIKRSPLTVLTPHIGEQKRLRSGLAPEQTIEEAYNALCIYKGPHSRICLPGGEEFINLTGNDALGTAGTGDVLAGMISALMASEESEIQGVRKAVLLHGLAAELFPGARESFTASDIIEALPRCFQEYRNNYMQWNVDCYGKMETLP
ncbi:NAD(P)H-hydrate dehydratase [Oceanispirochaeta sp.]|jgi:hydroxyethylthiazole kinase-like uncharacterized protein yjeF|uniref:NAD(P)H-hydrate dehydratase n=1 Tax=Oceanispirochaeta sp. TaxID=2035350 RepID=UPI00262FE73E|nr:NAD(P)H-hydrate dehydratase [Oceanispirochaeta sp.]MDA3956468.1 NAD(P)H-hydrate dehydratase [Oceanispirochaeta sp.]